MTKRDELAPNHLTNSLLVRAIDDELSPAETAQVESHLPGCDECKQRLQDLHLVSDRVESAVDATLPHDSPVYRERLAQRLEARDPIATHDSRKVLRRFSWGMGLAATLAAGVLFAPWRGETGKTVPLVDSAPRAAQTFDVNGETFVSLPYSNPDLPVNPSHIVRMQIPVSSLADAGVVFEAVSTQVTAPDRSVIADVLLGVDGQPLGVHLLNPE